MGNERGLLSSGLSIVLRNKRYILWFYVMNLFLGLFGTVAFVNQAGKILDHSLQSEGLLHGLSIGVLAEMFLRPEFGPTMASRGPAIFFALLFLVGTALFLPGVFQGYASTYRLPREDFFRACGRNLWRFVRLLIVSGILMGVVAGVLFALNDAHVKHAEESTNELLPFEMQMLGLFVIFLVMTTLRIWFDLAEADIVLNDQRAVRKSIGTAFRHTFRSLGRLLATYILTTIVAGIILVGGLWSWMKFVSPEGVLRAFVMGQFILLLLLIPRFWQRGVAVSYWQQHMMAPVAAAPAIPPVAPAPIAQEPHAPIFPVTPAGTPST